MKVWNNNVNFSLIYNYLIFSKRRFYIFDLVSHFLHICSHEYVSGKTKPSIKVLRRKINLILKFN
jgi:hypothetical protein